MGTLSLTLAVAGVRFVCTLQKSIANAELLGYAIQQHRKNTLRSSVGMLPNILMYTY
uniref:Uncharacterized protein MANES_16G083300 n=1 Tax=Rhizophora mucronata TaxID=61149 RepID=A0A2P2K8U3_RHIMU